MRLKASDKTSCLALRCGGASLGGDRRHRASRPRGQRQRQGASPHPTSCVRRTGMVTMRIGPGRTPAAPSMSPSRVGLGESRKHGMPHSGK